jgi:hypothetical protein
MRREVRVRPLDWLADRLGADDDPEFWRVALGYILAEATARPDVLAEVGRRSHWLRPHQSRWTADGGFAWPSGYGSGSGGWYFPLALPQFDWSVVLGGSGSEWAVVQRRSVRTDVRIAIPSRTRRHRQAAIHTLWHLGREKELVFYGFRRRDEGWACTASKTIR